MDCFLLNKRSKPLFGKKQFDEKVTCGYKMLEKLGSGAFSDVYTGEQISTRKKYAVKCISKKHLKRNLDVKDLENEISIMKKMEHENVISLVEVFDNKSTVYIILQMVTGGELFDRIVERGSYTESDASHLVKQILNAVAYIHRNKIVHRDLKPENLLYYDREENSRIMITDFGLAKYEDNEIQQTASGTPEYIAPEVLLSERYGRPVDCWAIGVITYILLCGYPPFYHEEKQTLYKQIIAGTYEFDAPYWDEITESAKDFVTSLIAVDKTSRLTCEQALQHHWIQSEVLCSKNIQASVAEQFKRHKDAKSNWRKAINASKAIGRMQNVK